MRKSTLQLGVRTLGLALSALLLGDGAAAQQASITGRVTDQATSQPLVGARIQVTGTNYFAITSQQGTYAIRAVNPGTYQLRAIMLGYASQQKEATVTAGQATTVDWGLTAVPYTLEEIVTTATGEQLKRELGNSVSSIEAKQLVDAAPVTNLTDVLNGRVAGVVAVNNDGVVGGGSRIRIRGLSSATLSNDPLVYVDGIRVSERGPVLSTQNGGSSPSFFNDLNPEEIESIEIVKGPSASTLYGTQASNGVIRITTKRGRSGDTRWTVYSEHGIVQDRSDYLDVWFAADRVRGPNGETQQCFLFVSALGGCEIEQVYNRNLLKDKETSPLKNGLRQQYGVQVNGGTDAVRYFVSTEFEDQGGTIKMPNSEAAFLRQLRGTEIPDEQLNPSHLRKINLRTNLSASLTPKLDVSISTGYVNNNTQIPQTGDNLQGVLGGGTFASANPDFADDPYGFARPAYGLADESYRKSNHFINSGNLNYRPLSWLATRATLGLDYIGFEDQELARNGEACPFCGADRGIRILNRFQSYKYTGDVGATATFQLSKRIGSKTAVGLQYNKDNITVSNNKGLVLAPGAETFSGAAEKTSTEQTVKAVTLGSYIEQQFSLDDRLFVTGAFRIDRNSSFGANNRTAHYPKLSTSFVAMEQKASGLLSSLRLRAAYGETGQQPNPLASIFYFSGVVNSVLGVVQPGTTLGNPLEPVQTTGLGNASLRPERSREIETGFDAGLFGNRLNLEVTFYSKRTRDALIDRPIAGSLGATFSRTENLGIVRNQGVEVSVFSRVLDGKNVQWDLGIEASTNQNKLLELAPNVPSPQGFFYRHAVGYPLYGHWATQLKSFADADGNGIIDPTEVVVSDTAEFLGSNTPRRMLALNSGLTLWKNLRIGGQLEYKGGFRTLEVNTGFQCLSVGDCRAFNDPTTPLVEQAKAVSFTFGSYIEKADFVRLRELSIGYTLPKRLASAFGSSAAVLTLTGRNLWLLTSDDFTGWDPEINTTAGLFGDGPAYNFVQPGQPRSLIVRLNLQF